MYNVLLVVATEPHELENNSKWPKIVEMYEEMFNMKEKEQVDPGPEPPDYSNNQISLQTGVWFDDKPWDKEFGEVKKEPKLEYKGGDKAEVSFYGAHPNNNLRTEDTFLKVERQNSDKWVTVYTDNDFGTVFRWKRDWIANSVITCEWNIPLDQSTGVYRIKYFGNWKSGWTGQIKAFSGLSREFRVT